MAHWLLQANPAKWDVDAFFDRYGASGLTSWSVTRYRDRIEAGDDIALWISGPEGGVIALGEVTGQVREDLGADDEFWIDKEQAARIRWSLPIRLTQEFRHAPISRHELERDQRFSSAAILSQPFAGNPFPLTDDEWAAILEHRPSSSAREADEAALREAANRGDASALTRLDALLAGRRRADQTEAADGEGGSQRPDTKTGIAEPLDGQAEAARPTPARLREQVEWVSDSPASRDLLGREALARALATRLRRLCEDEPRTSFLVHVDGRWGTGKSTMLNFLRGELEQGWLVVEFDAWRQSSVGPAWWALLATLRHDYAQALGWPAQFRLRLADGWVRIRRAGAPYGLALWLLFLVVAAGVFLLLRPGQFTLRATGDLVLTVTAVVSALGTLWAGALVAGRFLAWDSARGARVFEESNTNPMRQVADHFAWLLRRIGRPVVFLIDDLDRCGGDYVVELLDAVQTLVRDAPRRVRRNDARSFAAYFVVAADGAWIRTSYEAAHQVFVDSVAEPGRPLGYLFLDKLFQLTVPIPSLSPQAQATYLEALLHPARSAPAGEALKAEAANVRRDVEQSSNETEVVEALRQASQPARQLAAEAAVDRLTDPEVEAATEHVLQRYAPLLDTNPRSMKRFLNSYSIMRAVRTLEGNLVPREALALWVVLQSRWPSLADYLHKHPEAIDYVGKADDHADAIPEALRSLFDLPELQRVVAFDSAPLTAELIRACCGTAQVPAEAQ